MKESEKSKKGKRQERRFSVIQQPFRSSDEIILAQVFFKRTM
jgi:hypothetical protein